MGLFVLFYFVVLILGLIVAFFATIAQFICWCAAALLDGGKPEPVVEVEVVRPQRQIVAATRSEAEARLDRYCGTW